MDSYVWSTSATQGSSSSEELTRQPGCACSSWKHPLGRLASLEAPFSKGYLQGHPTGYLLANPGKIAADAESRHELGRFLAIISLPKTPLPLDPGVYCNP